MAKKPNFANEIDSIANSVEADVDRVINLLRDGNAVPSVEGGGSQNLTHRSGALPIKAANSGRLDRKRNVAPPTVHRPPIHDDSQPAQILENVTTRLTRETNLRLTEAALRQKLAKQVPDSRQAIIEESVNDWLARNGYA